MVWVLLLNYYCIILSNSKTKLNFNNFVLYLDLDVNTIINLIDLAIYAKSKEKKIMSTKNSIKSYYFQSFAMLFSA